MDEKSPLTEQVPETIGRYKIQECIGSGAMGAVYKAFDPLIKRMLAIKTIRLDIPKGGPQYRSFKERFYHEARMSGNLSHPNIVTLFDIVEEADLFLAMEFVEGETIAARLEKGYKFKPEEVISRLDIKPGDEVADLGAGSGYFTLRMAREVGQGGRVYAVDTNPEMLKYIEKRAEEEQLDNIQTILADANDPKLGSESVDLIFICDVLHHISHRERYYPLLARALRLGGRLVDIDFYKRELPVGPPVEMKIAKKDAIKEIEPAGFDLVHDYDFLKYQYFLVFELAE